MTSLHQIPAAPVSTVPLTSRIETLVQDVPGWSPVDQLFTLATLVYATADIPGDIVEVGSWHGRSAIVLGEAARATHGSVHCIDLFPTREDWYRNDDGTWSFRVRIGEETFGGYQQQTVWADPFEQQVVPLYDEQPDVLGEFRKRIVARGLQDVVHAHRGTSATFAGTLPDRFRCRLLFLDGDHGYDAVRSDIEHLAPRLSPGGWIVFDDAFSTYEGVNRAITELVLDNPAFDLRQQMTRKCFAARRAPLGIRR